MKIFKRILFLFYTIYAWFYVVFAMTGHMLIANIVAVFYKDKEWGRIQAAKLFIAFGRFVCFIRLKVQGRENIPKKGNFILVANHQSHIDIVMFMSAVNRKFAFIAKKELLKVPILGWDLRTQGHIMIDRGNARSAIKQIDSLKKEIKEKGKSVLFFPEGTRTADGTIGDFKKGAFKIAVQTKTPIIPCYINGTFHLLNKNSLMMKPSTIKIVIGKPIYIKETKDKASERQYISELMHEARETILELQRSDK